MYSIFREIEALRSNRPITIDNTNRNRYCVVLQESDGSKTAYYFSTPIYNIRTRKSIDMKFHQDNYGGHMTGSNAHIAISDTIHLENAEGNCRMRIGSTPRYISEREMRCGNDIILPTTNGIAYKAYLKNDHVFSFEIEVNTPFMNIRANDKYFALMREKFRPFMTVSCIGTVGTNGEIIAPAQIRYQKLSDRKYRITITPCSPLATQMLFEVNLYEPKLFQDTTVESRNPHSNNAFGGVGFVGNTSVFGEQWLYSRLDFSGISALMDQPIHRALLHIPKLNKTDIVLRSSPVSARFCSFGSNWDNKVSAVKNTTDFSDNGSHYSLELTDWIIDSKNKRLKRSEGWILRTKEKSCGFSAIATGDSYYAPQILEIHFR